MCKITKMFGNIMKVKGIVRIVAIMAGAFLFGFSIGYCYSIICKEEADWMAYGPSNEIEEGLMEDWITYHGERRLGIAVAGQKEMFCINLAGLRSQEISSEALYGKTMQMDGLLDAGRRYFSGKIMSTMQNIFVVDLSTMEYVVLEDMTEPYLLGDYFVDCNFDEENEYIELLLFYCPV